MFLSSVKIENFKNYEAAEAVLYPGLVCFTGSNGAGKTNLLDAIYYLCTGKSYFNSIDQQLIRDDADFFSVKGEFVKNNIPISPSPQGENPRGFLEFRGEVDSVLCVLIKGRKKVIKCNDEAYTRLIDHYGVFPVVMVAPGDMELITGGSEERRKWLDSAISLLNNQYLIQLIKYDKILQQRNAELRKIASENGNQPSELIGTYNAMMAPIAEDIHNTRKKFCQDFQPFFADYYHRISLKNEEVSFQYLSAMEGGNYAQMLEHSIKKDLILQRTNVGPHRDDLDFQIGGKPLRKFGSQGQQKTFLLALKLAERQFIKSETGQTALLLLDDVCERLDGHRLGILFRLIVEGDADGQVFLTDTSAERVKTYIGENASVQSFKVEKGKLEKEG